MKISEIPPTDQMRRDEEKWTRGGDLKLAGMALAIIGGGQAALFAATIPISRKMLTALRKKRKKKPESEKTDSGLL